MMTARFLTVLVLVCVAASIASARLGEGPGESDARYGKPIQTDTGGMYALMKDAEHRLYHHEGWQVYVAFVDGKAACIEYSKLRDPEGKESVVIQPAEIDSLLEAEAGGGTWTKQEEEASSNPFKALGRFVENSTTWKNSNGATAMLKQNRIILRFETGAPPKPEPMSGF